MQWRVSLLPNPGPLWSCHGSQLGFSLQTQPVDSSPQGWHGRANDTSWSSCHTNRVELPHFSPTATWDLIRRLVIYLLCTFWGTLGCFDRSSNLTPSWKHTKVRNYFQKVPISSLCTLTKYNRLSYNELKLSSPNHLSIGSSFAS